MAFTPPTVEEQINQVEHNMTNHAPIEGSVEKFEKLRAKAKAFGFEIAELCPDSREKSLAQTNLEQALMWAVASVARNQKGSE